jgi:hypothetical protein
LLRRVHLRGVVVLLVAEESGSVPQTGLVGRPE